MKLEFFIVQFLQCVRTQSLHTAWSSDIRAFSTRSSSDSRRATGKKIQNNVQNIIHKGIALRPFEKKFNLDPLIEVTEAILSQGMLNIKLFKRDPEIIQPKKIEIKTT